MLQEIVQKSRSIRSFRPNSPLSRETLTQLIQLARMCPAAMNQQPLKYRLVTESEEIHAMLTVTRWASSLPISLPPVGHEPGGFIVICHDTTVAEQKPIFSIDVGIVAQTIMLGACEMGLGGCIIGSADAQAVAETLAIPSHLIPVLVLGLGIPEETVVLTDVKNNETRYWRDERNIHYVPKRSLDELIIQ